MPYKAKVGKPKMKGFSQKHVMTMDKLMKQGHSFPKAHALAMKRVGKRAV